jgi:hypothetical protein
MNVRLEISGMNVLSPRQIQVTEVVAISMLVNQKDVP